MMRILALMNIACTYLIYIRFYRGKQYEKLFKIINMSVQMIIYDKLFYTHLK